MKHARTAAVIGAVAAFAAGPSAVSAAVAQHHAHPRQCAAADKRDHKIGATGLTWTYADADVQREFHAGPCLIMITGPRESHLVRVSGKVLGRS